MLESNTTGADAVAIPVTSLVNAVRLLLSLSRRTQLCEVFNGANERAVI